MKNSKRSDFIASLIGVLLSGCVSSQYKVVQSFHDLNGLLVTPDRVLLECEDLHAGGGDRPGSFGFMIHILDEEKTVLTGILSLQVSQSRCHEIVRDIERIMKSSKQVYIAGHVNLKEPRTADPATYTFPEHGTFHSNGRSMQWVVLKGEDGTCVSAYNGSGKPCPWESMLPKETMPF